jgi:hypothetical protein
LTANFLSAKVVGMAPKRATTPKAKKIEPIPNAAAILDAIPPTPGQLPPFPKKVYNRTVCPACNKGFTKWNGTSRNYWFTCTNRGCAWDTRTKVPHSNFILPELKPKKAKKVKPVIDSQEYLDTFRAEIRRRTEILTTERAKFPPTLIQVGKGKKRRWKANPKFTNAMRQHMHTFAFTHEQVREEVLKNGGK